MCACVCASTLCHSGTSCTVGWIGVSVQPQCAICSVLSNDRQITNHAQVAVNDGRFMVQVCLQSNTCVFMSVCIHVVTLVVTVLWDIATVL